MGHEPSRATLKRSISLPLLILYGLGTTIGAGIYVLVGKVAGIAGYQAPLSFAFAALIAGASALSFAEMASRFPFSAGETQYVHEGLGIRGLPQLVGFLVVAAGLVSSAAILKGSAGYLGTLVALPDWLLLAALIGAVAGLAAWGIAESVTVAAVLTVLEIGALVALLWFGRGTLATLPQRWESLAPTLDAVSLTAIAAGGVLAFYAFIGFEDMVNVAEEVRSPSRIVPPAIIWTLAVTTALYVLVALVCILAVEPEALAASDAPVAFVWTRLTGWHPAPISLIATAGVLNGALIQTIMASRVIYGMAARGWLPPTLAAINPHTRTPMRATMIVMGAILVLAYWLPVVRLAEITSFFTLIVFTLVNAALWRLKMRPAAAEARRGHDIPDIFVLPVWVPVAGTIVSGSLVAFQIAGFVAVLDP